ncbi:MAG: aldo/keto reductase, partial [Armatimonadetes bacterium]|nr:aldo/keto reductase [Armatimonadota bacterium]NIO95727.1 aldo/keto reductase [Armatimonadota bacterium]
RAVSMAGLSLAWVISHPLVTAPVVGPRKVNHFQAVREALELKLNPVERKEITAI